MMAHISVAIEHVNTVGIIIIIIIITIEVSFEIRIELDNGCNNSEVVSIQKLS